MRQLTVDPEFRDKIPPLSADEFSKLEENIVADREVREPLVVWHNTIIDGHHRWKIIQKHPEIPYRIKEMDFSDKWAAIVWMCRNQLGRRNVTTAQRDYIIKEEHDALLKTHGVCDDFHGNQYLKPCSLGKNGQGIGEKGKTFQTRKVIAEERGIKESQVRQAVEFGRGLDAAEKVSPGIKVAVLSGAIKAPKQMIAEIRNLSDEDKKAAVQAIKEGKKPDKKNTGRLTSSDIDLIAKITAGLKNKDKPPVTKEELAEDFGRILMSGVSSAYGWLEPRYKNMGSEEVKKIISALEQAEAEITKMKGMFSK